jgi:hypothetical protein
MLALAGTNKNSASAIALALFFWEPLAQYPRGLEAYLA